MNTKEMELGEFILSGLNWIEEKKEKFSWESEPENPERYKRRQSIKTFLTIPSENQKLSKIIESDVRHGTENSKIIAWQLNWCLVKNLLDWFLTKNLKI